MNRPTDEARVCTAAHLQAACYNIGGVNYVLDDLENGILRGNAPGAATLGMLLKLPWLSKGPFKQGDPRAQHVRPGSVPHTSCVATGPALVCVGVGCTFHSTHTSPLHHPAEQSGQDCCATASSLACGSSSTCSLVAV